MFMKILILLLTSCLPAQTEAGAVRHELRVKIDPAQSLIEAEDLVTFPDERKETVFSLHKDLSPSLLTEGAALRELRSGRPEDGSSELNAVYTVSLPKGARSFRVKYGGVINHPVEKQSEDYARGFSETPGLITGDGCYLAGSTIWYPEFGKDLSSFRLETDLPEDYDSVAGGIRISNAVENGRRRTVWDSAKPLDEITLACGRYKEYAKNRGGTELFAFLRAADDALAARYLDAAGPYLDMYAGLLGPYPYGKFALVENFWETGYGVPSFTLLGAKVLRLPFIINTSYPHEILHNWLGNGVFVDHESGNWSEGLTAYLADHLMAETRGKSGEYRMAALQRYADFVRGGRDFPLREFRSRNSPSSEAVGYGKGMMVFHMLRRKLGDDKFREGLREFYKKNIFRRASFDDLRLAFEKRGGVRLEEFFSQWTDRSGAPRLELRDAKVGPEGSGYILKFTVAQTQDGPLYSLEVPVAIHLEGVSRPRHVMVPLEGRDAAFKYSTPLRPVRVEADPEFDLFRGLAPLETPPTLSRLLGGDRPLYILPGAAPEAERAAYAAFAAALAGGKGPEPELVKDTDLSSLPADRHIWVLGRENAFYSELAGQLGSEAKISANRLSLENREFPLASGTFVFAGRNPGAPAYAAGLALTGRPAKLPLLAGKLPHYGKYGYLAFDSDMVSVKTGVWRSADSPLSVRLGGTALRPLYPPRVPLASPESVFKPETLGLHLINLASPEGRGPGGPGREKAAVYIEKIFARYGLRPFFKQGFAQEWEAEGKPLKNLAGMVPGSGRGNEMVIICAHYDHLAPENGRAYPGADDNASGVALLLELAAHYSALKPERTMVFAAFDGEEQGRLGSRHFVRSLGERTGAVNAAVNLDTVGRLNSGRMLFLGADSSDKWPHILRAAGLAAGAEYEAPRGNLDSSDQTSFIEAGVPAVQLFSGTHADYHKFSDTPDKIDYPGMVKEAEFLKEILDYLAGAAERIDFSGTAGTRPYLQGAGRRKVSTGLVPSFDWLGAGVKADGVTPGSPLSATPFKAGDIVTAVNGEATDDLASYSRVLKKYGPGEKITITYLSEGREKTAELELSVR